MPKDKKRKPATAPRRHAAPAKTEVRTRRHQEEIPRYRHYETYKPDKPGQTAKKPAPPSLTIRRRNTVAPVKNRSDVLRRRRIVVTVAICLVVILSVIAAKILVKPAPIAEPRPEKAAQTKPVEPPAKSEIELKKDAAEQNLKTINDILDSTKFSTSTVVKLQVPIYTQVYKQSCELASLRMALSYRGIQTTDLELLKQLNYDDQPAKKVDGKWIWGDPHQTYVGEKDGDQTKMTGYGVFAEPIAMLAEKNGRAAEVKNNPDAQWLARQIYAGNPVVIWGVSIKIADAEWSTPDGRTITAPMRTHTRTVVGVKGDPNNPIGFFLNDPAGKEIYWTTKQLTDNIAAGVDQAVAIY